MIRSRFASTLVSLHAPIALAAVLAVAWLPVTGCSGGGCDVDGTMVPAGASFGDPDGCNSCTCTEDGTFACTEMACAQGCEWNGEFHEIGESFPEGDGCNTCSCDGPEMVGCTLIACNEDCVHNGETHPVGSTFPAGDGCNTCSCDELASVSCTELACPTTCVYAGVTYEQGESFPALDGCNTCTCGAGGQEACTKVACPCDPAAEWYRDYVGASEQECEVIDFGCPDNTGYFTNDCGCGCEQDSACPQYFDCQPPAMCDVDALKKQCPYSKFAL